MRLLFSASAPVDAPLDRVQRLIDDEWVLGSMLGAGLEYVDAIESHLTGTTS